ncbi:MAG: hypothetical protein ACI9LV_000856 [Candidatus Nanohaloarchaea archaeon]|jgi:hypothetical protein
MKGLSSRQAVQNIDRKSFAFLLSGLMIGAVVVFLGMNYGEPTGQEAAEELVSTLEQQSGQDLELVSVETRNGLHRIQVSDQNNQLTTYYMSPDGQLVAQESGLTDFNQFKQQVSAQAEFSECLQNRNVVMFGNRTQRATVAQIQTLGGINQVSNIYADVNNEQILQQAVQLGVSQTPAFYYNNSTAEGLQTIPQLEQFTGCNYSFNQTS